MLTISLYFYFQRHVKRLADNYEGRSYCATPPLQIKYIRELPGLPQFKSLIE